MENKKQPYKNSRAKEKLESYEKPSLIKYTNLRKIHTVSAVGAA
ncbi:MAG: hypothetical protein Q8O13_03765 [Candidatus Omnitrophota bacterium]|nr:hypothetical protein [Candidatus Omnitrophota bacterium]